MFPPLDSDFGRQGDGVIDSGIDGKQIIKYDQGQQFGVPNLFFTLEFVIDERVPSVEFLFQNDKQTGIQTRLTRINRHIISEIHKWWKVVEIKNPTEVDILKKLITERLNSLNCSLPEDTVTTEYSRAICNCFIRNNLTKFLEYLETYKLTDIKSF